MSAPSLQHRRRHRVPKESGSCRACRIPDSITYLRTNCVKWSFDQSTTELPDKERSLVRRHHQQGTHAVQVARHPGISARSPIGHESDRVGPYLAAPLTYRLPRRCPTPTLSPITSMRRTPRRVQAPPSWCDRGRPSGSAVSASCRAPRSTSASVITTGRRRSSFGSTSSLAGLLTGSRFGCVIHLNQLRTGTSRRVL